MTDPNATSEREALITHALALAAKGVQINDGHTYGVPAHDLVDYAETIRALVELLQGEPSEVEVKAAAHALSEWLNDNAPIGEERYLGPARSALKTARGAR